MKRTIWTVDFVESRDVLMITDNFTVVAYVGVEDYKSIFEHATLNASKVIFTEAAILAISAEG